MTEALRTDHGQRPEEKAGKVDFGQTKALTGTLIKAISQAVSTLPGDRRRLGEVVLLKGRSLGEERIGGKGAHRGRVRPRVRSGVGEPETEMLRILRITVGFSMEATTRMGCSHRGHTKGSVS